MIKKIIKILKFYQNHHIKKLIPLNQTIAFPSTTAKIKKLSIMLTKDVSNVKKIE
jgi:hypothetical protein